MGVHIPRSPRLAVSQALNLALLFHVSQFMDAAARTCRVFDEWRKKVAREVAPRDLANYLRKCYPNRFYAWRHYYTEAGRIRRMVLFERLSNGNVVIAL